MTTTVDTSSASPKDIDHDLTTAMKTLTVEEVAFITKALSFKDKERLLDMIEQQIFEEEEDNCVETEKSIAQRNLAKAELADGDCMTIDEFMEKHSIPVL